MILGATTALSAVGAQGGRGAVFRPDGGCAGRRGAIAGAVLLEVVLALVLFVGAAAIIGAGLGSSVDAVERQKLNMHAANLATTVLAELQLGLRGTEPGPESFPEPFAAWTWELRVTPMESETGQASGLTLAEVVVRHADPPVAHRLAEVLMPGEPVAGGGAGEVAP